MSVLTDKDASLPLHGVSAWPSRASSGLNYACATPVKLGIQCRSIRALEEDIETCQISYNETPMAHGPGLHKQPIDNVFLATPGNHDQALHWSVLPI